MINKYVVMQHIGNSPSCCMICLFAVNFVYYLFSKKKMICYLFGGIALYNLECENIK